MGMRVFLEIEAGLVILALALAFTAPSLDSRWFEVLERHFYFLEWKRRCSAFLVGPTKLARSVLSLQGNFYGLFG